MSDLSDVATIAGSVAGVAIAVVGAFAARTVSQQNRVNLANAKRKAYAGLWQVTGEAAPSRLQQLGREGVLSPADRQSIHDHLATWYYTRGNGMLLDEPTRSLFLKAKDNLVAADAGLVPSGVLAMLPADMTAEAQRGCMSIRQLSLLRTQMKAEFEIYGSQYVGGLSAHERAFLVACDKTIPQQRAWKATFAKAPIEERCGGVTDESSPSA